MKSTNGIYIKFPSPGKGEGLFAAKNLKPGEDVVKVQSHIIAIEDVGCHCTACSANFEENPVFIVNPITCPVCRYFKYCSSACQEGDRIYHEYECEYYRRAKNDVPNILYRMLMRMVRYAEENKMKSFDLHDHISHYDINSIKTDISNLKMYVSKFASGFNTKQLVRMFRQGLKNNYAVRARLGFLPVGVLISEEIGKFNHSCQPNCYMRFDGSRISVVTLQEIKAGEELTILYHRNTKYREARKEFLLQYYGFDCQCPLCASDPNELPEAYRTARQCSSCKNMVIGTRTECEKCKAFVQYFSLEDCLRIKEEFDKAEKPARLDMTKYYCERFYGTHWLRSIFLEDVFFKDSPENRGAELLPLIFDLETGDLHRRPILNPFEEAMFTFIFMISLSASDRSLFSEKVGQNWLNIYHRGFDHESPVYQRYSSYFKAKPQEK